jgi:hypothetical protein
MIAIGGAGVVAGALRPTAPTEIALGVVLIIVGVRAVLSRDRDNGKVA